MDDGPPAGPDERFERIPWEQLMADATGGDRRRWMFVAGAGVVAVGLVAFFLGSGRAAPTMPSPEVLQPPVTTLPTTPPSSAPAPALASEADLLAPDAASDGALVPALEAYLAGAFTGPGTVVDHVRVEPGAGGEFRATLALVEVGPAGRRPLEPLGLSLRAVASPMGVVVERLAPAAMLPVLVPDPAGEVADVADPIRDGLIAALEPWPGSWVEAAGNDGGRWWARVGIPLPSGGHLPVMVWPDPVVGLGAGG